MTKKQRRLARQAAEAEAQKQAQEQVQAQVEQVEATVVEETPTPTTAIELDPEIQALEQALTAGIESLTAPKQTEAVAEVPAAEIQETVKTVTDEQIKQMSDVYVDTSAEQIKTLEAKINMLIGRLNAADAAYRALQKERDDAVDKLTAEKAKSNDLTKKAVELTSENNQLKTEKTKLKELCNSYALQAKHAKEVAEESQKQTLAIQNQLFAQKEAFEDSRAKMQYAYSELEKKYKQQLEANESMKEYYSNRLTEYLKAMKASGMVG